VTKLVLAVRALVSDAQARDTELQGTRTQLDEAVKQIATMQTAQNAMQTKLADSDLSKLGSDVDQLKTDAEETNKKVWEGTRARQVRMEK
jgi:hypothetical protein